MSFIFLAGSQHFLFSSGDFQNLDLDHKSSRFATLACLSMRGAAGTKDSLLNKYLVSATASEL